MPGEYMHIVILYLLLTNNLVTSLSPRYSLIHRKLSPVSPPTFRRYFVKRYIIDIAVWYPEIGAILYADQL